MRTFVALIGIGLLSSVALADVDVYSGSVSFTSDQEPDKVITLPTFDDLGGTLTLTGVAVTVTHSGSALIQADNDDPDDEGDVRARIIRSFFVTVPDLPTDSIVNGFKNNTSDIVHLGLEDGDGGTFDSTPPDGYNFGQLAYTDALAGVINPDLTPYLAPPGTIDFIVDVDTIVNDLTWVGAAPDTAWQLEVQNPILTVDVEVAYTYIPEPASLILLALGTLLRRR